MKPEAGQIWRCKKYNNFPLLIVGVDTKEVEVMNDAYQKNKMSTEWLEEDYIYHKIAHLAPLKIKIRDFFLFTFKQWWFTL